MRKGLLTRRSSVPSDDARRSGLTLAELLVALSFVIVLVFLLWVVVNALLTQLETRLNQARITKAKMELRLFADALERYAIDNGDYPTTEEGLNALFQESRSSVPWKGRYLKGKLKPDPWGTPYVYAYPGTYASMGIPYDLLSYGRDRKPGGTGADADIAIWDLTATETR